MGLAGAPDNKVCFALHSPYLSLLSFTLGQFPAKIVPVIPERGFEVAFSPVTDFIELFHLCQCLSNAIPNWEEHIFLRLREALHHFQDQKLLLSNLSLFLGVLH